MRLGHAFPIVRIYILLLVQITSTSAAAEAHNTRCEKGVTSGERHAQEYRGVVFECGKQLAYLCIPDFCCILMVSDGRKFRVFG
ncbi:hypothetical protein F4604DRAFT_1800165 [Suillus subluteus]|nr:hypothetical protein F4604DRAFT_1800165 [Suillus subluteus]